MARTGVRDTATNLSAVVATGAGATVDARGADLSIWAVTAASVTTGGTVKIEASLDETNWYEVGSVTVTANGTQEVIISDPHPFLRTNVSARTDGTYTTKYALGNS